MAEELERARVYKQLDWSPAWRGILYTELALMAAPALLYVGLSVFWEALTLSYAVEILAISFIALFALRYRQPAGWMDRELANLAVPRFLSHRLDVDQPPFAVPQDTLWPRV